MWIAEAACSGRLGLYIIRRSGLRKQFFFPCLTGGLEGPTSLSLPRNSLFPHLSSPLLSLRRSPLVIPIPQFKPILFLSQIKSIQVKSNRIFVHFTSSLPRTMEEDESDRRASSVTTSTTSGAAASSVAPTNAKNPKNRNSTMINNGNSPSPIPSPTPPNRKAISYSQPLSNYNPPALGSNPRRSSHRKHSLDDDRTLYYPHYLASPPPSYFPQHPNLPPLHHQTISSSGGSVTLERVMSEYGGAPGTLPEFTSGGGNTGIFRVPVRAAVHPTRPPALEVRPHPLRETQAGSFLRALVGNENQLWAASESGLRMWNLSDMWGKHAGGVRRGDEDSAPFYETSQTSPVICLAVDQASGFVWSGHKDGKIRSWKMDAGLVPDSGFDEDGSSNENGSSSCFTEGLSWQAHAREPVLSMVISSYG